MKRILIVFSLLLISLKLVSQVDTMKKTEYKTIVISDVHLGLKDSNVEDCTEFLKTNSCQNLFLNGDIIDGWKLNGGGKWRKRDSKFVEKILKLIDNGTNVVYLRGNHDDFLETLTPFFVGKNFQIQTDYIYESFGKKYIILHGDIFDPMVSKASWLAKLGSVGYDMLLWINRQINRHRIKKGLPFESLSQELNKKRFVTNLLITFEDSAVVFAKQRHCDGIICGHIHFPEDKMINGIHYLNSGDWVERKSALVEDFQGIWKIIYY